MGRNLPIKYAAFSACFRSEAGSAGRDTRGLIRQHQFNKVELVKFVKPEDSYEQLEILQVMQKRLLQLLKLPYRVMSMCTAILDLQQRRNMILKFGFQAKNTYREISSCTNFEAFQARRADIRFRREAKASQNMFIH